jgi:ariadne-1
VPCKVVDSFTCQICFESINPNDVQKFPCNHRTCLECLRDYLITTIRDAGGMIYTAIKCPGYACAFELEDSTILSMIADQDLRLRYQWIIANSFVKVCLLFVLHV